jgi:RNA polymerase sigma-70 factor (ECF subfamily)
MNDQQLTAEMFEQRRGRLRAVAYRMLGSMTEADDAVQETWIRASRASIAEVENLDGWLTTVTARVCLNMLRSRRQRREEPFGDRLPEPVVVADDGTDPEGEALLAESVGLALQIVLETLAPAERVAFVLHDMFAIPFDEIASLTERSPDAARQLASRARRRVRLQAPVPDADLAQQREVVDAYFAASRAGDFDALVAVLDPDVVLRRDFGRGEVRVVRGAEAVAAQARVGARGRELRRRLLVNGTPGGLAYENDRPVALLAFTVVGGRIVEIDILADTERLEQLDL